MTLGGRGVREADLHAVTLQLGVVESDETGGDLAFFYGKLLDAAVIVVAVAARAPDTGATWEAATTVPVPVAVPRLGDCTRTYTQAISTTDDG